MIEYANNLKLLWVVLIHKSNRHTHHSFIVCRYIGCTVSLPIHLTYLADH